MLRKAQDAAEKYANAQEKELAKLDDFLNEIDSTIGNESSAIYARLYTKNGTTDEVLILASSEDVFTDYSAELTLKEDFKNIQKSYTKEDLYEMPEYADILNSDDMKQLEKENPEEFEMMIKDIISRLNNYTMTPWRRKVFDGTDWQTGNFNLVEVRILDEIIPKTTISWFEYCNKLENIIGIKNLNTSNVKSMRSMFSVCNNLTTLDVSCFDTKNVLDMNEMFLQCKKLTSLDLSSFDTSNVIDMGRMFVGCSNLTILDLSNFDTRNVTNMSEMFVWCYELTTLNISNFDTSNVNNMRYMFRECSKLSTLDLSSFNTSNTTNMYNMFLDCSSLTTLDLSNFNTSSVTDMRSMFKGCLNLTKINVTASNWKTSQADVTGMFANCGVSEVTYK